LQPRDVLLGLDQSGAHFAEGSGAGSLFQGIAGDVAELSFGAIVSDDSADVAG
jgi:hypothetical protein